MHSGIICCAITLLSANCVFVSFSTARSATQVQSSLPLSPASLVQDSIKLSFQLCRNAASNVALDSSLQPDNKREADRKRVERSVFNEVFMILISLVGNVIWSAVSEVRSPFPRDSAQLAELWMEMHEIGRG